MPGRRRLLVALLLAWAGCDELEESRGATSWGPVGDDGDDSVGFVASSEGSSESGDPTGDSAELCNGIDDDDDELVDEDLGEIVCGVGECAVVEPSCIAGVVVVCTPQMQGAPLPESCNGLDDDCDGSTDEDVCGAGETGGGADEDTDADAPTDAYSACAADGDCPTGEHCVQLLGYCSRDCVSDGDCPAASGGSAHAACDEDTSSCYLVCGEGGTCPTAMTCIDEGLCRA